MDPNAPGPTPIPREAQQSRIPVAGFRSPDEAALHRNRSHERGQRLVGQSTALFAISALVLFGGCGAGVALKVTALSIAAVVLGVVLLVVSAVVGTIGRALQGRVL